MAITTAGLRRSRTVLTYALALAVVSAAQSSRAVPVPLASLEHVRVLLGAAQYEAAEVAARDVVAALTVSRGREAPETMNAADLYVQALLQNGRNPVSILDLAEGAVRTRESLVGPDHPDTAASLVNLGDVLIESGDFTGALAPLQRAVDIRERYGLNAAVVGDALDRLARAHALARTFDEALRIIERSLSLKEQDLAPSDPRVARTLEVTGDVLQRRGDYTRAGELLRRAVAIRESSGTLDADYVGALNLLGLQLWFEGDLAESLEVCTRALQVADAVLRADHPLGARTRQNLAATMADLGRIQEARELQRRALAIAEQNFGPVSYQIAGFASDLANSNLLLGDFPAARELLERALRIREERFGPTHDLVAGIVHNLAIVDARLGDYAGARRQHDRAMQIWERTLGSSHPFVAVALTELAGVMREQGVPGEARPLLERALAIRERNLGPRHRDVALTLADLAAASRDLGLLSSAQESADRALLIWEQIDAPDAPDLAAILDIYADLQARRANVSAARRYYEQALAIRTRVLGAAHPASASTQADLAAVLARLGNSRDAIENARQAEDAGREHLRLMLRYMSERQALYYAATRPKGIDVALSLVDRSPDATSVALDAVIRGRSLVLDEMAARGRVRTNETVAPLQERFAAAQQRLANLMVRGPGDQSESRYSTMLAEARREAESAERDLATSSAAYREERDRIRLGLEDVRGAIPSGTALVSYVRYQRFAGDPASTRSREAGAVFSATPSYLAFVLRPDAPLVAVPIGSERSVNALVGQWRSDLAVPAEQARTSMTAATRSVRLSGAQVRRAVWDPLTDLLNGVTTVYVVPDGPLSLVPFAAFPVGDAAYLLESGPVIHYLSAERDLVAVPDPTQDTGRGLLALGGPAFDDVSRIDTSATGRADPGCDIPSLRFSSLDGTAQEVREIANIWSGSVATGRTDVRVGRDASEEAFKAESLRRRVIHLATHGFFLGEGCGPASQNTRAIGGLTTPDGSRVEGRDPLMLSGLALAGANQRAAIRPGDDDGILTAEEVAVMDLAGVEWAVLSACDTGVGRVSAGEGVFGLRRAFQIAGVRTVVMSLWSVDDQATRAWMRVLYEGRFQRRLSTVTAVQEASLEVLRDRRARGLNTHPFYWAAFVASGDWR